MISELRSPVRDCMCNPSLDVRLTSCRPLPYSPTSPHRSKLRKTKILRYPSTRLLVQNDTLLLCTGLASDSRCLLISFLFTLIGTKKKQKNPLIGGLPETIFFLVNGCQLMCAALPGIRRELFSPKPFADIFRKLSQPCCDRLYKSA